MDSLDARKLFAYHADAMAYVDVEDANGDRGLGSAFHVGDSVFVTARHVVEHKSIIEVKITEPIEVPDYGSLKPPAENVQIPKRHYYNEPLHLSDGPFFSTDDNLDIAAFRVDNLNPAAGVIKLGVHYDDWLERDYWQMSEAIVLGYPPIPMVNAPVLIGAKAEIHTYVKPRHSHYVHFILSTTPRGGFSGGVAIHENGS
jgi:hypothetical protein